jgi:hypothetical protein
MCHKDHPLATFGTMSWPESSVATPRMSHMGCEMNSGLIPSCGRNCGFGIIRWPKLQTAVVRLQTNPLKLVLSHDSIVRVKTTTHTKKEKTEHPDAVGKWFEKATESIWPVADGSLSLRKSPCVRSNCPACAAGEGHRSHVLYGRSEKKRFSIYVPEELVPEVRAAIENGRHLKELIGEAGLRYAQALKEERKRQTRKSEGEDSDA